MTVPLPPNPPFSPTDPVQLERDGHVALGAKLLQQSFAVIEEHGLNNSVIQAAIEMGLRTFALPLEQKLRWAGPLDGSQRGYFPLQKPRADGFLPTGQKEAWHVRRGGHRHENLLPEEVPEFGEAAFALIEGLDKLARRVALGLDAALDTKGRYASLLGSDDAVLRFNYYPAQTPTTSKERFLAHCDFDLFTLLLGASAPGLEVEDSQGNWWQPTPSSEGIVAIAGDLLAADSHGRIRSCRHRVVHPPRKIGARLSIVYFIAPEGSFKLAHGKTVDQEMESRLREGGYRK